MDTPHTDSWRDEGAEDMVGGQTKVVTEGSQAVRNDTQVTITSSVFVPESVLSFTIS